MNKKTYQQPIMANQEAWINMPIAEIVVDSGKENDEQWSKEREDDFENYQDTLHFGNLW